MKRNKLFLQFYSNWKNHGINSYFFNGTNYVNLDHKNFQTSTILSNGFSSVYNICKNLGDFYWVNYDLHNTINKIIEGNKNIKLPIDKGDIYISAYFNVHLYQSYLWAMEYPNINFIVGGPAADPAKILKALPKNLKITSDSIEKLIGNYGTNHFGIDFPPNISNEIFWGYPLNRTCYWGKCLFCNYNIHNETSNINLNFENFVPVRKKNIIFLYTPSASPTFIKKILPNLNTRKDFEYSFFIRGSHEIYSALKETFEHFTFKKLTLVPGIEFPSDRMLNWLNKGTSTDSIIKTIDLIHKNKCRTYSQILLGFNNLKSKDISDAKKFIHKLYKVTDGKAKIKIHNLVCKVNTPIHALHKKEYEYKLGPFYFGYLPKLDNNQKKLNDTVRDIIYNTKFYQINDLYSEENIKNYEFC